MNNLILLIGKKGSGKSFIGKLIEQEFGIPFVRVEDWLLDKRRDRQIDDPAYIQEVFSIIENGIRSILQQKGSLVFESTGIGEPFLKMFENLQSDFEIKTIRINADSALCLNRIRQRNASIHIPLNEQEINQVNAAVERSNFNCQFQVNNQEKSEEDLLKELRFVLR